MTQHEPERSPHQTSRLAERRGRMYLLQFLVVVILCLLLPFFVEGNRFLRKYCGTGWTALQDYGWSVRGLDADVVLFGDSTSLFDIDPVLLSREIGLKVVNLPATAWTLPATRDLVVQQYLSKNRAPRLIVFFFSKRNLEFTEGTDSAYEGVEALVRHGEWGELARYGARHPLEITLFPLRFYGVNLPVVGNWSGGHELPFHSIVLGHVIHPMGSIPPGPCKSVQDDFVVSKTGDVRDLVSRYTSATTQTMVYLAPIARCTGWEQVLALSEKPAHELGVALPEVLPPSYFAGDGTESHIVGFHTADVTAMLAEAIRRHTAR